MKIRKCEKLAYNLHDKKGYVVHIRTLEKALNHRLLLQKVQRVIKFNQAACLKPCIDMSPELQKII